VLPTRIPNLLVNGSSGIAVGMATNIPPHNLGEVVDACLALLADPALTIADLIKLVPGPDFPTAGMIFGIQGVVEAYNTGRGRIYVRGRTNIEPIDDRGREAIIITELPYQVNKARLIERIAELVREKKLDGISELRDESDKDGMRVVIELKRGELSDVVLNNLYKADPAAERVRHQYGGPRRRPTKVAVAEGAARRVPAPPARGRHAAHALRSPQSARTRPRARRPHGGARERRRGHRFDSPFAFARRSANRALRPARGGQAQSRACSSALARRRPGPRI